MHTTKTIYFNKNIKNKKLVQETQSKGFRPKNDKTGTEESLQLLKK